MNKKFKLPEDMIEERRDKLISIKEGTFEVLEKEANQAGITLKKLISEVLDDYAGWVKDRRKKK
jgi:hypothetical protein